MTFDQLPDYWKTWLERRHGDKPSVSLFAHRWVKIRLEDGGYCVFGRAFCGVHHLAQELGVFTEHSGHHLFPLNRVSEITEEDGGG